MDTEGPESVPTAAHPDDRIQQHYCRSTHPTDTEGAESVPTAAHVDDRIQQHSYRYLHSTHAGVLSSEDLYAYKISVLRCQIHQLFIYYHHPMI